MGGSSEFTGLMNSTWKGIASIKAFALYDMGEGEFFETFADNVNMTHAISLTLGSKRLSHEEDKDGVKKEERINNYYYKISLYTLDNLIELCLDDHLIFESKLLRSFYYRNIKIVSLGKECLRKWAGKSSRALMAEALC